MNRCECHPDAEGLAPVAVSRAPSPPPRWRAVANFPFILAIRFYQVTLAPLMSGHCRFIPTCSNYAIDAYRLHGPLRGSWLTLRRLARCHPWGGNGFDPVPEPGQGTSAER